MEEKLVSIILPTYKQTLLFKEALKSIINQSYTNIEVIVVDDNEEAQYSEFVKNVIESYDLNFIYYHKNKYNSGSAYSRNAGIKISKGDYIAFLDDDDRYETHKIEKQVLIMIKEKTDYSVCNIAMTKDNKKFDVRKRAFLKYDEPLLVKHIKYKITATSTLMFKAKFLKHISGFDNEDLGDEYFLMEKAIKKSLKFSHLDYLGVIARVDAERGLSSWKSKIKMENLVFSHTMLDTSFLKRKDIRYIKMRHFASKGRAYLSGGIYHKVFMCFIYSVFYDPVGLIRILLKIDF